MKQSDITRKVLVRFSKKHLSKLLDELMAETSEFSKHPGQLRYKPKMTKDEIIAVVTDKPKFEVKEQRGQHILHVYMPYTYRSCMDRNKICREYRRDSSFRVVLDGFMEGTIYSLYKDRKLEETIDLCIKYDVLERDMFFEDGTAIPIFI